MDKAEVLGQYFGHSSFRDGQAEIIDSILGGRDCLAVMPTGAGKSMCYQIPALMMSGVTVVISPLISLMKDQVQALLQSGVSALYINSTMTTEEYFSALEQISRGGAKLVYAAPERLESRRFIDVICRAGVSLVAVDEAHCVSHWGQDFRPSFLKISQFVGRLPRRPVLAAFTATATDIVKRDIVKLLGLADPFTITTGFDRKNLYFEVRSPIDKDAELLSIIRGSYGGSCIVYCSTRRAVDSVCHFLNVNKISAACYHAGLSDEERHKAQDDFIYDRCSVIVATNAFGMGIDKSDVSLVVHYNMPKDLESYYQEAGRAGRDGSPARCILLYSYNDVRINNFLIEHSHENDAELSVKEAARLRERDRERLNQMTFYCTTNKCLRGFILGYFGDFAPSFCGNCSTCNANYDTEDITLDAQKILSCVFRLKQRERSADPQLASCILCGLPHERIPAEGLESLSTYGIMRGAPQQSVLSEVKYLCGEGYLRERADTHLLELTELADEFIKKRGKLLMKVPKALGEVKPAKTPAEHENAEQENAELMQLLKELRKRLAATLSVPAYVVFADTSLREMSVKQPVTIADFMKISGVGSRKAERYGSKFIQVILDYQKQQK